jgi:hypothetical protein
MKSVNFHLRPSGHSRHRKGKIMATVRFFLIMIAVIVAFAGCGTVPSGRVKFISRSNELLYVVTDDFDSGGNVKVFDSQANRLVRKIVIPDLKKPFIRNIAHDKTGFILQVSPYRIVGSKSNIYTLNAENRLEMTDIEIDYPTELVGSDNNYYYFRRYKESFRYDKKIRKLIKHHFEENPELLVVDIWSDNDYNWYVCLQNPTNYIIQDVILSCTARSIALVAKPIGKNEYQRFELIEGTFRNAYIVGDEESIWVFTNDKVIKFTKKMRDIEVKNLHGVLIPIKNNTPSEKSNHLWTFNPANTREIKCINKMTMEINSIFLVKDIKPLNNGLKNISVFGFESFCEDDKYIWGGLTLDGINRSRVPYLLKIDKNNYDSQLLVVKPTLGEASETIMKHFFADLATPVMALIFLIFGPPT